MICARPVIKFSHRYPKLLDKNDSVIGIATLLDVTLVEVEDLHPSFLAYDTDNGSYPLPKRGAFLQLVFLKPSSGIAANLFTTLRRAAPGKHGYYASMVGREFIIHIKEGVAS